MPVVRVAVGGQYAVYVGSENVRVLKVQNNKRYNFYVRDLAGGLQPAGKGKLGGNNTLSGLSAVLDALGLARDDMIEIEYSPMRQHEIVFSIPRDQRESDPSHSSKLQNDPVLARHRAAPIQTGFLGDVGDSWKPELERDLYFAFGLLQDHLPYRFLVGASKRLFKKIGVDVYAAWRAAPDAILVDKNTGVHLVAEFKILSSMFWTNHYAEDVDVLVCWENDGGRNLPREVLELKSFVGMCVAAPSKK